MKNVAGNISVKTLVKIILIHTSLLVLVSLISGCSPSQYNSHNVGADGPVVVQKPLRPTNQNYRNLPMAEVEKYEQQPTTVQTPTGTIQYGNLKLTDVHYEFDKKTQQITVKGQLAIIDQATSKPTYESAFQLQGVHQLNQAVVKLVPNQQAENANINTPIIRAKVTCVEVDANDNIDCSKAIIDFFVKDKKQIFAEQLETQIEELPKELKPEHLAEPTEPATPPEATEPEFLQEEGEEDSVDGRYQGQVQNTDFDQLFEEPKAEPAPEVTPAPAPAPVEDPKKEETKPTETDKPLNQNFTQTITGDIRQSNQAIGFPNRGKLRNSTSLKERQTALKQQNLFLIVSPERKRHYGTYEMAEMIARMGQFLNATAQQKLYVGSLSIEKGGKLRPHKSHQIGMDVDLSYPANTAKIFPTVVERGSTKVHSDRYSVERTLKLFKHAFSQKDIQVERIFVDQSIIKDLCNHAVKNNAFKGSDGETLKKMFQNISHVAGHGDHFHMRLKCTKDQPACKSLVYRKVDNCKYGNLDDTAR